jgi:sugar diacid utilization regulator
MKQFRGLIEMNKRRLKEVDDKIADTIAKKKYYEKNGETVFVNQLNQLLVMYEQTKQNRAERLATSEKWMEALEKVRMYAKFSVGTNKEKIKIFKEQYEESKQAARAARGLKKAVNGDPSLTANFNVAMEVMEQQMSANIGEVEDMLQATTGLLREADLENGVANEKANAILAKYDRGEGLFSEDTWKALPEGQERVLITMPAQNAEQQKPKKGRYFN